MKIPHDQCWKQNVEAKAKEVQRAASRLVTVEIAKDEDQTAVRRNLADA